MGGDLYRSFNCDPWDDGCSKLFGFTLSGSSFQGIVSDFPGCWFFGISCVFLLAGRKKRDGSGPLMALTIFGAAEGIALLVLSPLFDSLVRQRIAIQAYLTMPPVFALLLLVFSLIAFLAILLGGYQK